MPVFHVYLNGKKVGTAGIADTGVLGAHVSWVCRRGEHTRARKSGSVEEELRLKVGGLITPADEHVRWVDRKLKLGDEIRVVIAGDAPVDRPRTRKRLDPQEDLRRQKAIRESNGQEIWMEDTDMRTQPDLASQHVLWDCHGGNRGGLEPRSGACIIHLS